jgi:hypothetical protein
VLDGVTGERFRGNVSIVLTAPRYIGVGTKPA